MKGQSSVNQAFSLNAVIAGMHFRRNLVKGLKFQPYKACLLDFNRIEVGGINDKCRNTGMTKRKLRGTTQGIAAVVHA